MDLFNHIEKGKFGHNPKLKREAKHELKELGGEKAAEAHEKKVKMAGKMKPLKKHLNYQTRSAQKNKYAPKTIRMRSDENYPEDVYDESE